MEGVLVETNSVEGLLHELYVARCDRDTLTAELDAKIQALEEERALLSAGVDQKIAHLESRIRDSVISMGQSVKGQHLHAIYSKPRITWDSKGLGGYVVAHPEISAFRKEGNPSVSIRATR
jgi:hypothetical protein